MTRVRHESAAQRKARFEQFEQRLVMSAQAVTQLLPELDIAAPAVTQQEVAHPLLTTTATGSTSPTTEAAELGAQYGFDGAGQTVAVIDSGIAWDHYALGGGFGEGHKVVGGWDFAENDANPYDDGPAGFHGTHVSGIIGSNDEQYRGVASGADLVGLRVFDDRGAGNLDWVEQALQWVHDHKDDFENPITTVNLSLGTEWNAFTTPEWANLEDEFAQLESDGMFISVAAGNSFKTYGQAGLSYPAVSEHVTPVASHGADGEMSDFSQRADHVLVAPGESIKSTVPDHLFGGAMTNRFLGSTGTSMAAPYVAGASALLRQANEFMGVTEIDQDLLYQQFRETADQIYDSVTSGYYYKINLEAALASVVTDFHGDTAATATNLGEIGQIDQITGTIGKLTDVDHFSFVADADGRVTLNLNTTHDLNPLVDVLGSNAQIDGNQVTFDVVAGQQYQFSIAGAQGSGHYAIDVLLEATETQQAVAVDWGQVSSNDFAGQTVAGETTWQLEASRDGFLTIEGSSDELAGVAFEIYDSNMNRIATHNGAGNSMRMDIVAAEGETYYLKAIGNAESIDFHVDNLVSLDSGVLTITGTNQADVISVNANNGFTININGCDYQFDANQIQNIQISGNGGDDSLTLQLGSDNDTVVTTADGVTVTNSRFHVASSGTSNVVVVGGGGYDQVTLNDTAGDDTLVADTISATLSGTNYSSTAIGFDRVTSRATGGEDTAEITGSASRDYLFSRDGTNTVYARGSMIVADQFESVTIDGAGGSDYANLAGTSGRDHFVLNPGDASVTGGQFQLHVTNMETVYALGYRGGDSVEMSDTAGNDRFRFDRSYAWVYGSGYTSAAYGFSQIEVTSVGGYDIADIFDTSSNDTFVSNGDSVELRSSQVNLKVDGFENANMTSKYGGYDQSILVGSVGNDRLEATVDSVTLTDDENRTRRVNGFDKHSIDLRAGHDQVTLRGSESNETLRVNQMRTRFETVMQELQISGNEQTDFVGNGGLDQVILEEFEAMDLLSSLGDKATAYLRNHTVHAEDFAALEARTVENAMAQYDLEAVDYLYMLRGNWTKK